MPSKHEVWRIFNEVQYSVGQLNDRLDELQKMLDGYIDEVEEEIKDKIPSSKLKSRKRIKE